MLVSDGLSLVKAPILFFYLHSLILPLWSARRLTTFVIHNILLEDVSGILMFVYVFRLFDVG